MLNHKSIFVKIREQIFDALEPDAVNSLTKEQLSAQLSDAIDMLVAREGWSVGTMVRSEYVKSLVDELQGLGPLQLLMDDDTISDIMVNGPDKVFIERNGIVMDTDVTFIDEKQLLNIAKRIASRVGRRVDESSPTCDARMEDGSRVNVVIPPVAVDGTSISIRKFRKDSISLNELAERGTMTPEIAKVLKLAAQCRLNILISGGTGSGKTTMLNALSQYISERERVVTIEDAAELKLKQPHVVRLETKTTGTEGSGAITQRDLMVNALRMRPDRIVVGECRAGEAFEMLQAMNTGHNGSMSTLHANSAKDALARVEAMVMMASVNLPLDAIRRTITSAIDIVIQVSRLYDGSRKIVSISEVVGMEGNNIVMEDIFKFHPYADHEGGKVNGHYTSSGLMQRSALVENSRYFGLEQELIEAFKIKEAI
ncbi:CpaF family protein [Vibrio marisflavi]|uniref:Bacterial type II secretion system protein E domain-containing protein n=1 Tax=Vibrio marisflavi CECT 7928 TaxID=634439 RepID=A0ABN8E4D3_9VIBR|nr:CpaF family protein [Vibrio marisflavi]CAH0540333.1 hypothetical protein VMF7928_02778 [Vibrio marisflavi CECT 7928]